MNILINLLLIGVSLSMDTFSLSLSIGAFKISSLKILLFSILVGILHFIMPIIGNYFGTIIVNTLHIDVNMLLGIILLLIGIEMLIDVFSKEEKEFSLNIIGMFILAITVSLDSLTVGIGLRGITGNILLASFIFSFCSAIFTYAGLILGKYSASILGIYSKLTGIIIIFVLSLVHIF